MFLGLQGGKQRNTTRTILWDPLQQDNLQEQYGQKAGKSGTGYFCGISLTRRDHMETQSEAEVAFGDMGVF